MLRSENRSQTLSVPRYTSRPGIPGHLTGTGYVGATTASRMPLRRNRRSPHRNRRSPSVSDEGNGSRAGRGTPRSTRSNRSNNRERYSPRRLNNNMNWYSEASRSQERSSSSPTNSDRSRSARQRNQRDDRSPSMHSRRSPSASSMNSHSSTYEHNLQVNNQRDSDSSTDTENQYSNWPLRYSHCPTPSPTPRDLPCAIPCASP